MRQLIEETMVQILRAKAMEIRDVENGEEPFLYASGNWGPGYVSIKNLVGRKDIVRKLTLLLSVKIALENPYLNFVAGNVTGGMTPGWLLSEYLEILLGREIPFVYVRGMRKKGGQKELITGLNNNPRITSGDNVLVVEELVNFAETTCNSIGELRRLEFSVTHAACILFYSNPEAIGRLAEEKVTMLSLFTLPDLLDIAEKYVIYTARLIESYRTFLKNPLEWQKERGLKLVKGGGTQ